MARYAPLTARGVLSVEGEDARAFLQGIVSNDVTRAGADRAVYAALLTPQGKYLHDFIIVARGAGGFLLDCEGARRDDLVRRLSLYKLRAKAAIIDLTESHRVFAVLDDDAPSALGLPAAPGAAAPFAGGVALVDPRLAALGARAVLPADGAEAALEAAGLARAGAEAYEALRIRLGVPESGRDLVPESSLLLEMGFEELNGVDFAKGCYVGQEVTARMKHRKLVRKRLLPVEFEGPAPAPGTKVRLGEKEVGEVTSVADGAGLALLRLEDVAAGTPIAAGGATLRPHPPAWVRL